MEIQLTREALETLAFAHRRLIEFEATRAVVKVGGQTYWAPLPTTEKAEVAS